MRKGSKEESPFKAKMIIKLSLDGKAGVSRKQKVVSLRLRSMKAFKSESSMKAFKRGIPRYIASDALEEAYRRGN